MSKPDYLSKLLEVSKNDSATVATDGLLADCDSFVDTGCYALNALMSGSIYKGMPGNKILGLSGDPATGKTYFALSIARNFQKQNPTGIVLYFDSEGAITTDTLSDRGFDLERIAIFPVSTIEEFRNQAKAILVDYNKQEKNTRPPMLMVLDSLGMLSSSKEVEDIEEGKNVRDMTKSGLIRGMFRVLTLELAKANIPMIVTAHSYDQVGTMYPQKVVGGGLGLMYAASTIIMLSKRKERANDEVIGNIIRATLKKGRFAIENRDVELLLNYKEGLHRYYGLVPVAEKYDVLKKVSTRYELPDGSKVFESVLYKNSDKYFTDDLMKKIDEACDKEFTYHSAANTTNNTENVTTNETAN